MKTTLSLANRLREVLTEGEWITGTNFKEQITTLHWKEAVQSIDGLNSIAKLTFHILYYLDGVTQVLEGGPLDIKDKFSFDAPTIQTEPEWSDLRNRFCKSSEKFIKLVEDLPEEKLKQYFIDEKYGSYHRNIDVMIEHCYYHLGQILLIKKLIEHRR